MFDWRPSGDDIILNNEFTMIDQKVLRTDIVMDLGESLNPAIDIGQIEGGFMQGYGLFVMEQLIHSPEGALLTKG